MVKNHEPEKSKEVQASSDGMDSQQSETESEMEAQFTNKTPSSAPATQKKAQTPFSAKPQPHLQQEAASSSDEEDSGTESESYSDLPDMNVRPISSKPMDDPQKSNDGVRKKRSKPDAPVPVTPSRSAVTKKRPAEDGETEAEDAKGARKKPDPEKKSTDDTKKSLFQRLWSVDDEIVILQGMINYASEKNADPLADLNAFHEFIKKNLHAEFSNAQLQDKIRRLRIKYKKNKGKENEGKDRSFSNAHERKGYELSKSVWGNEAGNRRGRQKGEGSSKKANDSAAKKAANCEGEKSLVVRRGTSGGGLSVDNRIVSAGAELFKGGKGHPGDEQWRNLRKEEVEFHLKKLELRTIEARLVLDVLKSAGR